MSAPTIELMFFLSTSTNLPATGLTPTFTYYGDETGTPIAPPSITEIGSGTYKFTVSFPSPSHGVVFVCDAGATANPRYVYRYARPTDWAEDLLPDISQIEKGQWQIHTSGPYANQMVLYQADGTTVLQAFNLYDSAGLPTAVNAFRRTPA